MITIYIYYTSKFKGHLCRPLSIDTISTYNVQNAFVYLVHHSTTWNNKGIQCKLVIFTETGIEWEVPLFWKILRVFHSAQRFYYHVCPTFAWMIAAQRPLMDCTRVRRVFWELVAHSISRISTSLTRVPAEGWLARMHLPRTCQRCSNDMRSGEHAGQAILMTWCSSRKVVTMRARCAGALSSWKITPG